MSLATDQRALPRAIARRLRSEAHRLFRETATETTFDQLLRMTSASDPGRACARITALGWMGDQRASAVIGQALTDPVTCNAAQSALVELLREPATIEALLTKSDFAHRSMLAAALSQVESFAAIKAAARLSVEASETETLEASVNALAHGREWLQSWRGGSRAAAASHQAAALAESMRAEELSAARGVALIAIAETLGTLASILPHATAESLAGGLPRGDEEDEALARLAFFDSLGKPPATEELTRAQHHRSSLVRMRAINTGDWQATTSATTSLILHLMDEVPGVRRAAARAMRRGDVSTEARRALMAALADEDIWVRAEVIVTLGMIYGEDAQARVHLREALGATHPLCRVAAVEALCTTADAEEWRTIAHIARHDPQPEVRRAAVLAFAHCHQSRRVLSVTRAALKDKVWSVRRAAVESLGACHERSGQKLLLEVASREEPVVRGAALRALAARGAAESITLACRALDDEDPMLAEDAYAAFLISNRLGRTDELRAIRETCAPRAAAIIDFILQREDQSLIEDAG